MMAPSSSSAELRYWVKVNNCERPGLIDNETDAFIYCTEEKYDKARVSI